MPSETVHATSRIYEANIICGRHNGHFRANYLGHAGKGVLVVERRDILLAILSQLRRIAPNFALASRDLGARWWQTMARTQLPMKKGTIFCGALLGFTLSVVEVMISLFLTTSTPTLPVNVWNQTPFGSTPAVNAILTCIGVFSLILVLIEQSLIRPLSPKVAK